MWLETKQDPRLLAAVTVGRDMSQTGSRPSTDPLPGDCVLFLDPEDP